MELQKHVTEKHEVCISPFFSFSRSTLKACKAQTGHQTRENVSQGRNHKRFRSVEPSHIMEVKQTETVDLQMTSPAKALLPDAQCREYLFSNTWQGKDVRSNPLLLLFTSLPSFVESTQFHKMNVKVKKDSTEQLLTSTKPSLRFQLCILSVCLQLSCTRVFQC